MNRSVPPVCVCVCARERAPATVPPDGGTDPNVFSALPLHPAGPSGRACSRRTRAREYRPCQARRAPRTPTAVQVDDTAVVDEVRDGEPPDGSSAQLWAMVCGGVALCNPPPGCEESAPIPAGARAARAPHPRARAARAARGGGRSGG